MPDDPDDEAGPGRNLIVLCVLLVLACGCVWLFNTLRREAQLEDCLAARRLNCDALVQSPR